VLIIGSYCSAHEVVDTVARTIQLSAGCLRPNGPLPHILQICKQSIHILIVFLVNCAKLCLFVQYDALSMFSCPPSHIMTKSRSQRKFPQLANNDIKYR
jgi:hypothetical protein